MINSDSDILRVRLKVCLLTALTIPNIKILQMHLNYTFKLVHINEHERELFVTFIRLQILRLLVFVHLKAQNVMC